MVILFTVSSKGFEKFTNGTFSVKCKERPNAKYFAIKISREILFRKILLYRPVIQKLKMRRTIIIFF
jgi:hypothetical protein